MNAQEPDEIAGFLPGELSNEEQVEDVQAISDYAAGYEDGKFATMSDCASRGCMWCRTRLDK